MASLGTRTAAALSVVVSAVLGYAVNILSSHWSWGIAVGCIALIAASVWLAVRDAGGTPPDRARLEVTSRRGGRVLNNRFAATDRATATVTADDDGTIANNEARIADADATFTADHGTIESNDFTVQ